MEGPRRAAGAAWPADGGQMEPGGAARGGSGAAGGSPGGWPPPPPPPARAPSWRAGPAAPVPAGRGALTGFRISQPSPPGGGALTGFRISQPSPPGGGALAGSGELGPFRAGTTDGGWRSSQSQQPLRGSLPPRFGGSQGAAKGEGGGFPPLPTVAWGSARLPRAPNLLPRGGGGLGETFRRMPSLGARLGLTPEDMEASRSAFQSPAQSLLRLLRSAAERRRESQTLPPAEMPLPPEFAAALQELRAGAAAQVGAVSSLAGQVSQVVRQLGSLEEGLVRLTEGLERQSGEKEKENRAPARGPPSSSEDSRKRKKPEAPSSGGSPPPQSRQRRDERPRAPLPLSAEASPPQSPPEAHAGSPEIEATKEGAPGGQAAAGCAPHRCEKHPLATPSLETPAAGCAPSDEILLSRSSSSGGPHGVQVLKLGAPGAREGSDPQSTIRTIRQMQQRYLSTQSQPP